MKNVEYRLASFEEWLRRPTAERLWGLLVTNPLVTDAVKQTATSGLRFERGENACVKAAGRRGRSFKIFIK